MNEPMAPEVEALVLSTLRQRVEERLKIGKALLGAAYPDGHRETFRSPLDQSKLGTVYRTDPEPKWVVTDWDALNQHLREFPGNVETFYEIADDQAAIDVLQEHAPHLLVEISRIIDGVVDAAIEQSRATGEPAAPGISLVKASGSLTVRPDPAAAAAVERMVRAGVITWDGRPVIEAAS